MTIVQKKRLNLSVGTENLMRLCWLRGILLSFEGIGFLLASFRIHLPTAGLLFAFLCNLLLISSTIVRLNISKKNVSDQEFFVQLLLDLLIQTTLLFFSGGYTNPLVSIYLVTVSIGAALLPRRYSWSLTFSAALFYTVLMKWYLPAGFELEPERSLLHQRVISTHLLGMWITFVLSALLINYFVELMASALRKQQEDITIARERQLRDENILAIAIQAAGAAHELGTPLATMAIVLGDLQYEYQDKALADSLRLLRSQVEECKRRLQQLVAESQYHGIERVEIREFLCRVIEKWQLIRPESGLHYKTSQWPDSVFIPCDLTLYQAITALLDNAEDASPGQVSLSVKHAHENDAENIAIQIFDKGMGFPQTCNASRYGVESMNTPLIRPCSQKENGLGLGLLLSQASIERLGGQVHIFSQRTGGTLTEILLPVVSTQEPFTL
ncbi:ATP-binding protein [Endozoicomonas sp.]|uniref:ATP-binding protein n=1 Tax=Endozoicomonas sp. TaxID=1892382 RepID=UPI00383BC636